MADVLPITHVGEEMAEPGTGVKEGWAQNPYIAQVNEIQHTHPSTPDPY